MRTLCTVRVTWALLAGALVVLLLAAGLSWSGVVYVTKQSAFCGNTCHVMGEAMVSWQASEHVATNNDRHVQAECIDCHFAPGEKATLRAQYRGLRHLAAYLYDPDAPLPIRAVMPEVACEQCHARDDLADKAVAFTEKVTFKHGPHLDQEVLAGQRLTCDNCHVKVSAAKHFEVSRETCFLCHFMGAAPAGASADRTVGGTFGLTLPVDFLEGRSRCETCHAIPTESLQRQKSAEDAADGDKVITHQTLRENGVPCGSCHYQVVQGDGAVAAGNVDAEGCLSCHNRDAALLARAGDGRAMHDTHVMGRRADCFECHAAVNHGPREDHYRLARGQCTGCHDSDQHKYQQVLLEGTDVVDGLKGIPGLMHAVNTNCMGCHREAQERGGHRVLTGSGKACADCHVAEQAGMADDWKKTVEREVGSVREIRTEAVAALGQAESTGKPGSEAAGQLVAEADRILRVVEYGNGVHNKKYSILLLDEAFVRYEEAIDALSR